MRSAGPPGCGPPPIGSPSSSAMPPLFRSAAPRPAGTPRPFPGLPRPRSHTRTKTALLGTARNSDPGSRRWFRPSPRREARGAAKLVSCPSTRGGRSGRRRFARTLNYRLEHDERFLERLAESRKHARKRMLTRLEELPDQYLWPGGGAISPYLDRQLPSPASGASRIVRGGPSRALRQALLPCAVHRLMLATP